MTITEIDKEGARKVYGLPLDKHLFMTVDVDQPAGWAPHLAEGDRAALSDPRTASHYSQLRETSTEELLEELRRRASPYS